jgi:transcription initiation factor TFIIB
LNKSVRSKNDRIIIKKKIKTAKSQNDTIDTSSNSTTTRITPRDSISQTNSNARSKTKKNKNKLSTKEKSKLWEIFDNDKNNIECVEISSEFSNKEENPSKPTVAEYFSQNELNTCKICSSTLIIMDNGIPTCTNVECGLMYRDILDYSPEWRFYGADDKNANDPTRCGNPINPLLVESSFGCKVLCDTKSSYEMKKIRKWTEWQSMPHKEKSLYDEFQFITVMAQNAGIPKIFIDYAMTIHKDISEQKMFRGMNRDGIKAASIYISCRLNGCPRTAHEIAEVFKLDKTSATTGCSMAVNILHNIERNVEPSQQTELGITMPSSFIERYCSKLNFNQELTMLSKFIANKIEKNNIITDNIPHAIAAGIVYFIAQSCKQNITKQDIKVVSGVSEVTINKCFKKLEVLRDTLLPSAILSKYA